MKKALIFAKRNLVEMVRDPILYIFCAGFPIGMMAMFQLILQYSGDQTPQFMVIGLVPGLMMFSYSILMLMAALLISKDRTTTFLKRLFTSPMKGYSFILGYFFPFFLVGIAQSVLCIALGYIFGATSGTGFCSFGSALLLMLEMLPIMVINIMIGMIFGNLLNDKSAPGVTSIFISASGIIGGAWMPLDVMGDFEKVCGYLPFYPATYLGRIITGASHTMGGLYEFNNIAVHYIGIIVIYLAITIALALITFKKAMKCE